jgi:hypothetical protein
MLSSYYVERVEPDGVDCWLWTGPIDLNGYGHVNVGTTTTTAHRAVYTQLVGPVAPGLELDHLCRVRRCVNPDHLEPVTRAENVRRSRRTLSSRCANGHERYVQRGSRRVCLDCRRDIAARHRRKAS